jgi:hypothetical protein
VWAQLAFPFYMQNPPAHNPDVCNEFERAVAEAEGRSHAPSRDVCVWEAIRCARRRRAAAAAACCPPPAASAARPHAQPAGRSLHRGAAAARLPHGRQPPRWPPGAPPPAPRRPRLALPPPRPRPPSRATLPSHAPSGSAEATRDAAEEPLLSSFLYASILAHDSFERALAFVLSNRLASAVMLPTQVRAGAGEGRPGVWRLRRPLERRGPAPNEAAAASRRTQRAWRAAECARGPSLTVLPLAAPRNRLPAV